MKETAVGRVLIIDDEETYRTQLSMILKSRGYEVETGANGRQGISVGMQFQPDLLIADWRLKDEMTGLDVAEALQKENQRLQVIMITGYSAEDLTDEAHVGPFRILEKPFTLKELLTAVQEALNVSGQNP
jgi:DNA-binding NtrC family response regulator